MSESVGITDQVPGLSVVRVCECVVVRKRFRSTPATSSGATGTRKLCSHLGRKLPDLRNPGMVLTGARGDTARGQVLPLAAVSTGVIPGAVGPLTQVNVIVSFRSHWGFSSRLLQTSCSERCYSHLAQSECAIAGGAAAF